MRAWGPSKDKSSSVMVQSARCRLLGPSEVGSRIVKLTEYCDERANPISPGEFVGNSPD